jgi:hypothetical protein
MPDRCPRRRTRRQARSEVDRMRCLIYRYPITLELALTGNRAAAARRTPQATASPSVRIASPEMLPSVGLLPHVICSPPGFGGGEHEADQHGDTR